MSAKPAAPAHTPEPWQADRNCVFIQPGAVRWWIANTNTIRGASGYYATPIAKAETEAGLAPKDENADADAARIVACVNACAGIKDPAALPALIEAAERAIGAIEACAVAERGGPPVNWDAVDRTQDALRAALANVRGAR